MKAEKKEEQKDYKSAVPEELLDHVLGGSERLDPKTTEVCTGVDFNSPDFSYD